MDKSKIKEKCFDPDKNNHILTPYLFHKTYQFGYVQDVKVIFKFDFIPPFKLTALARTDLCLFTILFCKEDNSNGTDNYSSKGPYNGLYYLLKIIQKFSLVKSGE